MQNGGRYMQGRDKRAEEVKRVGMDEIFLNDFFANFVFAEGMQLKLFFSRFFCG